MRRGWVIAHAQLKCARAMRVCAPSWVYSALRVAQAEAAACYTHPLFELFFLEARRADPGRRLRKPAM